MSRPSVNIIGYGSTRDVRPNTFAYGGFPLRYSKSRTKRISVTPVWSLKGLLNRALCCPKESYKRRSIAVVPYGVFRNPLVARNHHDVPPQIRPKYKKKKNTLFENGSKSFRDRPLVVKNVFTGGRSARPLISKSRVRRLRPLLY